MNQPRCMYRFPRCPRSSVVERSLGKTEVMGPIPIGGSVGVVLSGVGILSLRLMLGHRCGGVAQLVRAHGS